MVRFCEWVCEIEFLKMDSFIQVDLFIWLFVKKGIGTENGNENIFSVRKVFLLSQDILNMGRKIFI